VTAVDAGLAGASAGPKDTRRGATGGGAEARGLGGKAAVACSGLRRSPTAGDEGPRSGLLEAVEGIGKSVLVGASNRAYVDDV